MASLFRVLGARIAAARRIQIWRVFSGEDPFDEATMIDDEEPPVLAEHPLAGHPTRPVPRASRPTSV